MNPSSLSLSATRSLVSLFQFRRLVSLLLIFVLCSNQVQATPQGFTLLGAELSHSLAFWWYNSGWAAKFAQKPAGAQDTRGWDGKGAPPNTPPAPSVQEKQADRDRKVARLEISPRDVTIHTGEKVIFAVLAYDSAGNLVPGVKPTWDGSDENKKRRLSVSPRGEFISPVAGNYKVTVDALGKKDSVKVTVIGEKINPKDPGVKGEPISTRDKPKETKPTKISAAPRSSRESAPLRKSSAAQLAARLGKSLQSAPHAMAATAAFQSGYDYYTWNSSNYLEADDPNKERGDMPGHALDGGAGSGNFQFSAPLLALDGRGIDINLAMTYNSRLWHKSGSDMYFDIDGDYIPGWNFGFGRIVTAGNGYMLIDADGTRHSYNGNPWSYSSPNTSLQGFDGYTSDGSFINYFARGYKPQYGSLIQYAWAKLPNGTTITYGAPANLSAYPTQITDANGNYITITYKGNQGPNISTITDTLGRQLKFYYDADNLLTAVTAPGFDGGAARILARFTYASHNLTTAGTNYGFSGVTCRVQNSTIKRLKAIYYPATNTGYWFDEADSYSDYGMLRKISERRAMTFSGSDPVDPASGPTPQGTIGAGTMSRETVYSSGTQPGYNSYSGSGVSGSLTDVPTYTQMTEDWAGRQSYIPKPVTEYSVTTTSSTITTRITRGDSSQTTGIDGRTTEQITDNNPSSSFYGLLLEDTTYPNKTSTTVLSKSKVYWEATGATSSHYGAPRPTSTETTDERNQTTTTLFSYGANYNQVADVTEKGWNNQILRRTHTDYINTSPYIGGGEVVGMRVGMGGRHIYSLVSAVNVYATEDDSVRVARTEYQYDGQTLSNASGVVQHETVSDPYDAGYSCSLPVWNEYLQEWEYVESTCYTYDAGTDYRGNVTNVKRYADAQNYGSDPIPLVETRRYDICGNLRIASTSCCEQTSFNYTYDTRYAWPSSVTRGSASVPSQQNTTSAVYDFNTGLVTTSYDANGLYASTTYDTTTLRPVYEYGYRSSSTQPVGYAYHEYYDNAMIVVDFVYKSGDSGAYWANRMDKYLDGHGRVIAEIGFTVGYHMDVVDTLYDQFGRVFKQTRPYRRSADWSTNDTQYWTTYNYDIQDRVTSVVTHDGSTTYRYYNESSYPSAATQSVPGHTIRVKDAWQRERWARSDEQNRLVEVVEPDPAGTGAVASNGLLTQYSYNTLGTLTGVTQGSQTRSFQYDSLGRLTNQHLAEREKTLDGSGGAGSAWSDYFKYDNRGNLIERIDARRVKTTFNYNSDPLNRLYQVSYDKSNAIDSTNIKDAATVTYTYEATSGKDNTRLLSVSLSTVNGLPAEFGNQAFTYDSEGRLSSVTQKYSSSRNAVTEYEYDTLDRVNKIKYPAQYGQTGSPVREAVPAYDLASRLQSLTYSSTTMANNPVYNASSQTTQLDIGSAIQEQYIFDEETGLLTRQKVKQGSTTHLDLTYDYGNLYTESGQQASWKTGQLSKITDNKNTDRNRQYAYDKLGRLKEAKGGVTFTRWSQTYAYDRYGNRTSVTKSGVDAFNNTMVADGLTSVSYFAASNRINGTNFTYDAAGNQTKSDENGLVNTYKYDAAGRLAEMTNSATHTYAYGAAR